MHVCVSVLQYIHLGEPLRVDWYSATLGCVFVRLVWIQPCWAGSALKLHRGGGGGGGGGKGSWALQATLTYITLPFAFFLDYRSGSLALAEGSRGPRVRCLVQSLSAAVVGSEQMLQQRNTWGQGGDLPEMDDMNREVTHIPCQSRASSTNIWGGEGQYNSRGGSACIIMAA